MFKRLLALLFALALLGTACGSDEETATDEGSDDAAETGDGDEAPDDGDVAASGDLPDLEGREITIAVENAYIPFNYIDPDSGEPTGWDYDTVGEICERLNCVPVYETFDWEPMIQAVADGQFDMAADGITITEERARVVDFSEGYVSIEQRIMVAADNDEITSVEDLQNADCPIGTQTGTTNFDTAVENFGEERVQAFDEFGFAVQSVIVGDVCAVIIDETAGQGYVGENAEELQLVGESLSSDELGFVFPKDSDLVEPFNAAIAAMKADGTLDEINAIYFSADFEAPEEEPSEGEETGAEESEEAEDE